MRPGWGRGRMRATDRGLPRRAGQRRRDATVATASASTVRGDRFGRAALRLAAAGIVVLLALGATLGAAGAEDGWGPINAPSLTKEEFIQGCLESNGVNIVTEYPEKNSVLCE